MQLLNHILPVSPSQFLLRPPLFISPPTHARLATTQFPAMQDHPANSSLPPPSDPENRPRLSPAEVPEPRLSTGARIAIYLGAAVLLTLVLGLMPTEASGASIPGATFPWLMFLQEVLLFASAFLPACLLAQFEFRAIADYGLPFRQFLGARFWQGCVLGLAEISLLIGGIALFGGYRFGSVALPGARSVVEWFVFWFVFFIVVGLYEEFAFRGYLQFTLTDATGFWPAAVILSLGFGSLHLLNRGENWVGAASVATVGLVFALALQRTGNLWFVVGWHAAFDFGETFLYSVPNSGAVFNGHLSNASLQGPLWLTGGSVGPEGSVFSFVIMGLTALLVHFRFPQAKYSTERSRPAAGTQAAL